MIAMSFKDDLKSDTNTFLDDGEFAELVTYSGTGQQIKAVIERGNTMDKGNTFTSDGFSDRALVTVSKADVPNPQQGETFTDETGAEWEIARKAEEDPAIVTLECIANERVAF